MKWFHALYVGGSVHKDTDTLIREVEEGTSPNDLYMITLAMNGRDLLDIRRTRALARPGLKEELPMVVGLANGHKEALQVVEQIVKDCLKKTGDVDLRAFLDE